MRTVNYRSSFKSNKFNQKIRQQRRLIHSSSRKPSKLFKIYVHQGHDHTHTHSHSHDNQNYKNSTSLKENLQDNHNHNHHDHHHHHHHHEENSQLFRNCDMQKHFGHGKCLFIDCWTSGAAGDMMLACLLDLGVPKNVINCGLESLKLYDYQLRVEQTSRSGVVAPKVSVDIQSPQPYRDYAEIKRLIGEAGPELTQGARDIALRGFEILAEAEGLTHGLPIEKVHFHEVGAVDSIVDMVGIAIALDYIKPDKIFCSPIPMGRGIIYAHGHGPLPNPPPATLQILCNMKQAITFDANIDEELITPTAAAMLAACAQGCPRWPSNFNPIQNGYGAGTKNFSDRPNLVRMVLGEKLSQFSKNQSTSQRQSEVKVDSGKKCLEWWTLPANSQWHQEELEKEFQLESDE